MRNLPYGFDIYLEDIKTMRTIVQIFGAFSEKLNFKEESVNEGCRWSKTQKLINVVCERPLRRCAAEVLSSSPPQFPPKSCLNAVTYSLASQ